MRITGGGDGTRTVQATVPTALLWLALFAARLLTANLAHQPLSTVELPLFIGASVATQSLAVWLRSRRRRPAPDLRQPATAGAA